MTTPTTTPAAPTPATRSELAHDVVTAVAAKLFPATPMVNLVPLRGGLEAAVARITLRDEARRERHVVVKRLASGARREEARYRSLAAFGVTPSFLGAVDHGDSTYLFLERVRPVSSWPWRDSANTRLVLEQLARVHRFGDAAAHADDWDYDAELLSSSAETVAVAAGSAASIPELDIRRELRPLRRVAATLGEMRQQMNGALGTTLIHGDVHSGNVMLRTRAASACRRGGRTDRAKCRARVNERRQVAERNAPQRIELCLPLAADRNVAPTGHPRGRAILVRFGVRVPQQEQRRGHRRREMTAACQPAFLTALRRETAERGLAASRAAVSRRRHS
jgi:hypothetical protein